jgi:hypothetical protein
LFAVYETMLSKIFNPRRITNINIISIKAQIIQSQKQFNHKNNSQESRTNEQISTVKYNKF